MYNHDQYTLTSPSKYTMSYIHTLYWCSVHARISKGFPCVIILQVYRFLYNIVYVCESRTYNSHLGVAGVSTFEKLWS